MSEARVPALVALSGALLAAMSLALAAVAGAPYLSASHVNGWILVFAATLFAAFFAIPFLLERRLRARIPDGDDRWERALLLWGAGSLVLLGAGLLLGGPSGFAGSSLAGSVGLIVVIEAALLLGTLVVWLLSG